MFSLACTHKEVCALSLEIGNSESVYAKGSVTSFLRLLDGTHAQVLVVGNNKNIIQSVLFVLMLIGDIFALPTRDKLVLN